MNKVVHCKKEAFDVYIGRPSVFGNPFTIGRDGNREQVIERFKQYFLERIENDEKFRNHILSLHGKTLACWCKPLACHGDVIAEWLKNK